MNDKISNLNTIAEARCGFSHVKDASLELNDMVLIVGEDSRNMDADIKVIDLRDREDIYTVLVGDFLDAGADVLLDNNCPRLFWASWAN